MTAWDRTTAPQIAVDLIARLEAYRLIAYQDSTGVWTVGYGTTVMPNGRRVQAGDVLPEPLARALMRQQAGAWCAAITRHVHAPLTEAQAAALISWVHNLGEGSLAGSTLAAMLNAGRADLAAGQFAGWVMAGGVKSLGLMRRRELERRIYCGADLSEYDGIWRQAQAAFEPAYARAFADAAAWHREMEPAAAPVARVTPQPAGSGRPVVVHAPIAEGQPEADALMATWPQGVG